MRYSSNYLPKHRFKSKKNINEASIRNNETNSSNKKKEEELLRPYTEEIPYSKKLKMVSNLQLTVDDNKIIFFTLYKL